MTHVMKGYEHEEQDRKETADQLRHHLGLVNAVKQCRLDRVGSIRLYAPYLIQLSPNRHTNINFWGHPTDEPVCETGIHNHHVDFASTIIMGAIRNLRYGAQDDPGGDHKRYYVRRAKLDDGQTGYSIDGGTERVRVSVLSDDTYTAGQRYGLRGVEYHSNEIVVPTITIMDIDLATQGTQEAFLVGVNEPDFSTTLTMRTPKSEAQLEEAWARIDGFLALLG